MTAAPAHRSVPRAGTVALILAASGLFVGLAAWMRRAESRVVEQARAMATNPTPPRPPADITSALRAMKLTAVEIDTTVKVERGDTSWRGDTSATLEVPVRLSYGTDLSSLEADAAAFSPTGVGGTYVIRVPRPRRISTEVFSEKERAEVETGWLRLRSRAGEYYLGLARRDAAPAARELTLLPDDQAMVDRVTREQVEALVRRLAGERVRARVVFKDEP